ncbi:MAG: T9SS type A sorting domain-containing protein, partial [Chitinophagales bacterium]
AGNIIWQNTIGGPYDDAAIDILQMPDGGYMVGGIYESYYDAGNFQLLKLKHNGAVDWMSIIGCGGEQLRSISKTTDGGFILGGRSNSYICATKTDPGPPNTYGWDGYDMWVVKTDAFGNFEWDNSLGGSGDDGLAFVRETPDGGYLAGGYAGADDGTWDKSNPWSGAWLVKLKDSICIPEIELCNTLDDNCNGIIDDGVVESIIVSADGATSFCSGSNVNLTVVSHTGNSLQWKKNGEDIPGATTENYTATSKGIYTCQTTSACAFALSEWIEVEVYKKPNAVITADGPITFCAGESVTLMANLGGGQTYQWYKNGLIISGATSNNYVATTTGNYKCLVTKTVSGCSKQSNPIAVAVTCKGEDENNLNDEDQFIIYPNPSSETITIVLSGTQLITHHSLLILTDLSGKTISEINITSPETEIDISAFPAGIYFVRMKLEKYTITEKFVKD